MSRARTLATVLGSDGTLDATEITTALGYTPVNKAGDTMSGVLYREVSSFTNVETNILSLVDSATPSNKLGRLASYNAGGYNQDLRLYTTKSSGDAEQLHEVYVAQNKGRIYFGNEYGIWTETMVTANGGSQTVQFISDRLGVWIVVGKLPHYSSLTVSQTSVRGIDTSTSQATTAQWSADFGNYYTSQVRIVGSTNWNQWRDNRTVDWVYVIPNNIPWGKVMTSGGASGFITGGDNWGNGTRYGFSVSGAYDGFGRWKNPYFTFVRIGDANPGGGLTADFFSNPQTIPFLSGISDDAKFAVHATAVSGGQDAELHQGFGYDDSSNGMKNGYPETASNMSGGIDVTASPIWFCIKVADPYTEA